MYHGILYDRTGRVIEIPGQHQVADLRLRTYAAAEFQGWIWVWMGDAASADKALIPPVVGWGHPDYILGRGQIDFPVAAHLVNDNLLDLSHVPFLHANSASLPPEWAYQRPKFTKRDRSVHTEWWGRHERLIPNGPLSDSYTRSDFYVPGVLIVTDRGFPIGTADSLNGGEPDLGRAPFNVLTHLVVPMADRSTRYFYCVGSHREYGEDAARARDALMSLGEKAFAEDKKMLEAQQEIMDLTPDFRFVPTANDRGVMLFKQVVQNLLREAPSSAVAPR
jgi:vanillate O-demethylase monooxygenase subunit